MLDLSEMIVGFEDERARSIAYYLTRYFKGSPHLEENGKDIFADVFEDEQDKDVREATLAAIKAIEDYSGATVFDFSEEQFTEIMDAITKFEESLTEPSSEMQLDEAEKFLKATEGPTRTGSAN